MSADRTSPATARNLRSTSDACSDRLQVLAVLDIIYLASCVYKPYKVLRDTMSAGGPSGSRSVALTRAMLYVELAARGLASVSQTAIVWVVVMVTIDRYLAVCRPLVGAGLRTLRCVQRAVVVVVVAAAVYNVPVFFENKVRPLANGNCVSTKKRPP